MNRKLAVAMSVFLSLSILLAGCTYKEQNAVTPVKDSKSPAIVEARGVPITLTCDPKQPEIVYQMQFNGEDEQAAQVFAGHYTRGINLTVLETGADGKVSKRQIADNLPFITRAKWSEDGRYLALNGDEKLYLYDSKANKFTLINEAVNTPSVTSFGFGPGNKLYTEHANLPNDVIYDLNTGLGKPAYQIDGQPLYYKDVLGNGLYAGTVVKPGDKTSTEEVYTVIADAQGKIVCRVASGRYRDHYNNAILNSGTEHFGLYYVADYKQPQDKQIYNGYVYQTAFAGDGSVIYSRPGTGSRQYLLCRFDPKTGKTQSLPVSGSDFRLSQDGKVVYVGGWGCEQIDALTLQLIARSHVSARENADIIAALRGAVDSYFKFSCQPGTDKNSMNAELKKWYVNTNTPIPQTALTDIAEELNFYNQHASSYSEDYYFTGCITSMEVKGDRAAVVTQLGQRTSRGSGWGFEAAYEMIKTADGWKVTGLSTFPESGERKRVEAAVHQFIDQVKRGDNVRLTGQDSARVLQGIKGKELQIGQIQFWRMSEPHRSPNVESANHARVMITTGNKHYKLQLEKKGFAWIITGITDRNLWTLL